MRGHSAAVRFMQRNPTKARLYLLPEEEDTLVKDYSGASAPIRLYGRFCLRNEERALRKLSGVRGIPAFRGRRGPYVLAMQFVEARPLSELKKVGGPPPGFVDRLAELFRAIEARGVAHGDPHLRNILCGADGTPYLVDFSFCYVRGTLPVLDGWIFRNFQDMRRKKLQKLRRIFCGEQACEPVRVGLVYRIVEAIGAAYKRIRRRLKKRNRGAVQQTEGAPVRRA